MKLWHFSPMRCGICGHYACYQELPICHYCLHVFQSILTEKCKKCGNPPYSCECNETARFLFFFHTFEAKAFMYFVKYNGDRRIMTFLAETAIKVCGINPNAYDGVTYVPRLKRRARRYGFDQSKEFAKAISKVFGIPLVHSLKRKGGRDQKLLSYAQRMKNIKNRFNLKYIPENKYQKLLLVDDIITTGATTSVCSELLKGDFAKSVTVLAIAKTSKLN